MVSQGEQDTLTEVFGKVMSERMRQVQLLNKGSIALDMFAPGESDIKKLVLPLEELGEVARAVRNRLVEPMDSSRATDSKENLEIELVQLATHVCTWRAGLIR